MLFWKPTVNMNLVIATPLSSLSPFSFSPPFPLFYPSISGSKVHNSSSQAHQALNTIEAAFHRAVFCLIYPGNRQDCALFPLLGPRITFKDQHKHRLAERQKLSCTAVQCPPPCDSVAYYGLTWVLWLNSLISNIAVSLSWPYSDEVTAVLSDIALSPELSVCGASLLHALEWCSHREFALNVQWVLSSRRQVS